MEVTIYRFLVVIGSYEAILFPGISILHLSLFDMLLTIGGGLGTWCSPCGSPSWVVLLSSWTWVLPFCSLYSPLFWALWFIYEWEDFISMLM
jgi:hypothetical protein